MAQRDAEFYRKAEGLIQRMLEEAPTAATHLGDHRYDDRLGRHTEEDIERRVAHLHAALAELESLPPEGLSPEAGIDREVLLGLVRAFLRGLEVLRGHVRDPGYYSGECLDGVFTLIVRDFAPLPERLRSALGRLREVPRLLAEGVDVWGCPIHDLLIDIGTPDKYQEARRIYQGGAPWPLDLEVDLEHSAPLTPPWGFEGSRMSCAHLVQA